MPHRLFDYLAPVIFPFIGMVHKDTNMKFSLFTLIEKLAVPMVIAVVSAWIATSQLTHVLEERLTNNINNLAKHIANTNTHMKFDDKLKLFTTSNEFNAYKTDGKETKQVIQDMASQIHSINQMLKYYSDIKEILQNYINSHTKDHQQLIEQVFSKSKIKAGN